MLIYLSASGLSASIFLVKSSNKSYPFLFVLMTSIIKSAGRAGPSSVSQVENSGGSRRSSNSKIISRISHKQNSSTPEFHVNGKKESSDYYENYLWLGPRGHSGRHLRLIFLVYAVL